MKVTLRSIAVMLMISLSPLSPRVFAADTITLKAAREIVDAVEVAMRKSNAEAVANYLSADCTITISVPKPDGSRQILQITRQGFIAEQQERTRHRTD